jgi:NADPH:quinone reductase
MRGFVLDGFDTAPALREDLPPPTGGEHQLLVRVLSSSVNPVDAAIAGGMLREMVEHDFPVVLGRDYVGVVEQVGPGVADYREGDSVFGFLPHANPTVHDGSWCDLITVPQDAFVAPAPAGVERETVGAAPLAGISAIAAIDALGVSSGDTVLIVGAAGGVGSVATQLTARAGATVVAPALPEDETYLRGLGATEFLDRDGDVATAVRTRHPEGDALLDLVSYTPDALNAYAAALKPGGRAASTNGAAGDAPDRANIMADPTTENLRRLAALLEDGVTIPVQASYPLERAADALQALTTRHTQGKIAITVAA